MQITQKVERNLNKFILDKEKKMRYNNKAVARESGS